MKMRYIVVYVVLLIAVALVTFFHLDRRSYGWYVPDHPYGARTVSIAVACHLGESTSGKRIIYDRRRESSSGVCVERAGALRDIKPTGVTMRRAGWDGSFEVSIRFDGNQAIAMSNVFRLGGQKAILYRGDTLLTRISGGNRPGSTAEVSSYYVSRDEAELAMSQVAIPGSEWPTHSWHR